MIHLIIIHCFDYSPSGTLIQPIQNVHVLLTDLKVKYIGIGGNSFWIRALG